MATTFRLGLWQLSRAEEKTRLQSLMSERQQMPVLNGNQLALIEPPARLQALESRAVQLSGQWLPGQTIFLDNRVMNRQAGFYVLTPLRLSGRDAVVWVQRGWAPRHVQDRQTLPPVTTPMAEVTVSGHIAIQLSRAYALGQDGTGAIRQNLDLDTSRAATGWPLAHWVVWQTGAPSDGLLRDWPVPASGVDKHKGYAFQWFGLCALITLLLFWFQVIRPLRDRSR
ncbi:SURF1 family protein [Ottowia sp.]|uniref:SURF1 family protein n=1 Tax=Ottowia sp. TaxID=1898956 RepID=UPI003A86966C